MAYYVSPRSLSLPLLVCSQPCITIFSIFWWLDSTLHFIHSIHNAVLNEAFVLSVFYAHKWGVLFSVMQPGTYIHNSIRWETIIIGGQLMLKRERLSDVQVLPPDEKWNEFAMSSFIPLHSFESIRMCLLLLMHRGWKCDFCAILFDHCEKTCSVDWQVVWKEPVEYCSLCPNCWKKGIMLWLIL